MMGTRKRAREGVRQGEAETDEAEEGATARTARDGPSAQTHYGPEGHDLYRKCVCRGPGAHLWGQTSPRRAIGQPSRQPTASPGRSQSQEGLRVVPRPSPFLFGFARPHSFDVTSPEWSSGLRRSPLAPRLWS